MINVISWNNGESAKAISSLVSNGKLLRKNNAPVPRNSQGIINFGCSEITRDTRDVLVLNRPEAVAIACSKLRTFETIAAQLPSSVPWFTTDSDQAVLKAIIEDTPIVCRTIDRGHGGAGIVVKTPEEIQADGNLPRAAVYVKAIKKRREYRVHCALQNGYIFRILDIQRKVRRAGVQDGGVNGADRPFIWNHDNDFVFQREGVNHDSVPGGVITVANRAIISLGLDFAAIDIVVEQRTGNCYVLEVNTSPGMEGTTLERYQLFFNHRFNGTPFVRWSGDSTEEQDDGSED